MVFMMNPTQSHLINTAIALFLGRGYGAVGTAELCRAAGVNKGTFYHFFASKAALLAAAIARYADDLGAEFDTIARSDLTPSEKLVALFGVPERANQAWKDDDGVAQGCLVGNMTLELGGEEPEVRAATLAALAKWKASIRPILAACREEQEPKIPLSDAQIDADANRIISLLQGGLLLAKAYDAPEHIGAMAPVALAMMTAPAAI